MWIGLLLWCEAMGAEPVWFETPSGAFFEPSPTSPSALLQTSADESSDYDWEALTDPSNAAFWGDDPLPAPLLALAKHPTPENQARVRQWMADRVRFASELSRLVVSQPPPTPPSTVDWQTVHGWFVYSARCAACQQAAPVLAALGELGANIQPIHLDRPLPALADRSVAWSKALSEGLAAHGLGLSVTPTWVLVQGNKPPMAVAGCHDVPCLAAALEAP